MVEENENASGSGSNSRTGGSSKVARRRFIKATGALSVLGIAGCSGGGSDSTPTDSGGMESTDSTDSGSDGGDGSGGSSNSLPSKAEGVKQWGERVNNFCRDAGIDWKQFEGTSLMFGMNVHPFTQTTEALLPYFEELTGISVQYNTFPEEQLWQKLTLDLNSETGLFDGFFLGLWPSARYHSAGWAQDLNQYFNDASLTDKDWYAMGDFPESAIEGFTYGDNDLVGLPIGIEAYGCLAYDKPTFEKLGIQVPTDYPSMKSAAKKIHESDEVDMAGICSRASSATLSSANWATMFKSYGADWLDYENKEAALNSQQGVKSLQFFSDLMSNYGPSDIGNFDWYKSLNAYGQGQVGMTYANTEGWGVFPAEKSERTGWIPPVPGPNGDQLASTWQWGIGMSQYTENPGAAWLFLQWATSRPMSLLTTTRQWQGQGPYGHSRSNWLFDQPDYQDHGQSEEWREATTKALDMVPSSPPPVPLQTPQNMDIMAEAAIAMNQAVSGNKSAKEALDQAAPTITDYAKEIPSSYINPSEY